ncbi:MAG: MarR family transcriptional regulator [Cellulomonas sp.]|uniref:MarR family winged helix-turn-helix transcriptional regulator n=1 Tax=Cellulomonas sp. TaxID=40001 RepID=UPI00182FBE36|nr:MarR family transcriptional regulator [Cellulomonas sp.]NMM30928.1 MarR family transcriptional regulator [Cellulomonas sp.]
MPWPPERPAPARVTSTDPADWPVGRLLSAAARRVEREWNAHLATWDLNHASMPVLLYLLQRPRSQRELASASGVTEQTMSRILARMERTGYVTRAPDENDHRKYVITIAELGRSVAMLAADPRPAEAMTTRGLTPDQVDELRVLLAIVAAPHVEASASSPHALAPARDEPDEAAG